MKLVRLIKLCLNEMYCRGRVGKHLFDLFPIRNGLKKGDAVSPMLFNFAVGHAIIWVQVNKGGLKLHGTHQIIVYGVDVNMLRGSVHIMKEKKQKL